MKKQIYIVLILLCAQLVCAHELVIPDTLSSVSSRDTLSMATTRDSLAADTMDITSLELIPVQTYDSLDTVNPDGHPTADRWSIDTSALSDLEIRWFDYALHGIPTTIMRMGEYYFPLFEEALARYNLPYELKYLPVIESALNPMARSHMGAAGLWQFMPATGKLYGLEINSLVDERMDPIRSTEAACRFLNSMYTVYHDWNLVIAAYNCGSGNVNKAIRRAGGKRDFWSIYPYLPRETRNYVPIFIAANYAMTYGEEHGICKAPIEKTMLTDTILTTQRLHLHHVSKNLDIPMDELRRLNPQYSRDILPGGTPYALCLPSEKVGAFIEQENNILAYKADSLINNRRAEIDLAKVTSITGAYRVNGVTYYTIKKGDTLGGIAKKFHCTVKQLKQWNGLTSDNIRDGKKLKICK